MTTTANIISVLKPKRTWLQYRLRTLFVLVVIAAVPCGWLKWKMDRKAKERAAVAAIQQFPGEVGYDWEEDDHGTPPGPAWMRRLLGDDFFADVTMVGITANMNLTDTDLVHLDAFPNVTKLWIDTGKVTDGGIAHIAQMKRLTYLAIQEDQITDDGVAALNALPRLTEVLLSSKRITDASVEHLQHIATLRNLSLRCDNLTDAGVECLRHDTTLESLDLSTTKITDRGLKHLSGVTSLRTLTLYETKITEAGVAELQKALPNCKILR